MPLSENLHCVIKKPDRCSADEIKNFIELVNSGGETDPVHIAHAIYNSEALAFYYHSDKLVSVGALKRPNPEYVKKVFKKSGSKIDPRDYHYEIGWLYTSPEGRGRGAGQKVIGELLRAPEGKKIFATIRSKNLPAIKIIEHYGFSREGLPYRSSRGDYTLTLYLNSPR